MRFPRCFINEGGGTRLDHAMSRIVNRDFLFGEDEKEYSRKTMRDQVVFSRSHFHLLLQVPDPESIDDEELSRRMRAIYSKINAGTYKRFQFFDLSMDPGQKTDLPDQRPGGLAHLKNKLLDINAGVMADAPDWIQSIGTLQCHCLFA